MTNVQINEIMKFPNVSEWQGRTRNFQLLQKIYGKEGAAYTIFKYVESERYVEKGYEDWGTKEEEKLYVCQGNLEALMHDLQIYKFNENSVFEKDAVLCLKLTKKMTDDSWFRKPNRIVTIEGAFYQLTSDEFAQIPFEVPPITEQREVFLVTKRHDSVMLTEALAHHFSVFLTPIKTIKEETLSLKYQPIIVGEYEHIVPNEIHKDALHAALTYDLTNIEFNFLNFFYLTGKALKNDGGQELFDDTTNRNDEELSRGWVRKHMKRLMKLRLVKHSIRHERWDLKRKEWYFYDATKNLDALDYYGH